MAIQSQPSRIPEPFAGSGTKNTIPATNATPSASQAASWASGFPPECSQPISAGGCPVPRNDVNGALNQLSQDYAFRQDGGIWEWSALADYDVSRVVRGSDGKIYYATQQSGPSVVAGAQDPTTDDGTYWTIVSTDDADVVHKTGAETIAGEKTFTKTIFLNGFNPSVPGTESNGIYGIDTDEEIILSTAGSVRDNTQGAKLVLYGSTHVTDSGRFIVVSRNSNGNNSRLVGDVDNLAWESYSTKGFEVKNTGLDITNPPTSQNYNIARLSDKNDVSCGNITVYQSTSQGETNITAVSNGGGSSFSVGLRVTSSAKSFIPGTSGGASLGNSARRWSEVFANSGSINTSDARLKTEPEAVPDEVLDAWGDCDFVQFRMLDAIKMKGADKARIHNGMIAQRIDEAFKVRGLDASRYGLFCFDEWEAEPERIGEDGKVIQPATPAGDCYSLRYEEALCMEAAYQRRRADRAEARLAALEERLAAIEAKLG